jgi:hypothetical protein
VKKKKLIRTGNHLTAENRKVFQIIFYSAALCAISAQLCVKYFKENSSEV